MYRRWTGFCFEVSHIKKANVLWIDRIVGKLVTGNLSNINHGGVILHYQQLGIIGTSYHRKRYHKERNNVPPNAPSDLRPSTDSICLEYIPFFVIFYVANLYMCVNLLNKHFLSLSNQASHVSYTTTGYR